MENKYVLDNVDALGIDTSLKSLTPDVQGWVLNFLRRPTDVDEFTEDLKKAYLSFLLSGAVCSSGKVQESIEKVAMVTCVEKGFDAPLGSYAAVVNGVVCGYSMFSFIRSYADSICPGMLREVTYELYHRAYPMFADRLGVDGCYEAMQNARYFWEPVVKEVLNKYSGCRARYDLERNKAAYENVFHIALTGLLRSGKMVFQGLPLPLFMAGIGYVTKPFPECIDSMYTVSDIYSKNHAGNGLHTYEASVEEAVEAFSEWSAQADGTCNKSVDSFTAVGLEIRKNRKNSKK